LVPERLKELEKAVLDTPPKGNHTCAHQVEAIFPCPIPSCPDSPTGNFLRLLVKRKDGRIFKARFKRTRVQQSGETVFTWRPA
jgi:hypothetical protein